jgi:formylglycine-generating enzyme required for sulfatase activity
LVCAALLAFACSLDRRPLSSNSSEVSGGVSTAAPSSSDAGAHDDSALGGGGQMNAGEVPSADDGCSAELSSCRFCTGEPSERRCAVTGGAFELGPPDARVPADVSSFQLDELEVTVGRFRAYVSSFSGAPEAGAGAHPEIEASGWRSEWDARLPSSKESLLASLHCNFDWETWSDEPAEREDYPLTCASYYVAFAFCAANGGRLPTEAEWEYAASGGAQQRTYPWGDGEPSLELALFDSAAIAPAGGHRSGMARFGQLDLAGSAWEWTLDLYRPYPERCDDCAELDNGLERVLRGGAFLYDAEFLTAAYRYHTDPQLALGEVGFRCAYGP